MTDRKTRGPGPPWRAVSLRTRAALWYAASVAAVLVCAALGFRALFAHALSRELDRSLAATAASARGFYQLEAAEYGSPDRTVAQIAREVAFVDRTLAFVAPDGRVIASSIPVGRGGRPATETTRRREEALDAAQAPGWRVRVEASTAPLARPIAQVDAVLLFAIPLGAALAGVAGWWVAGRALRPVADMADATEHVTPGAGLRLPVPNPDDELGRLGTRFNALLDRVDVVLAQQRQFLADAAHELRTPVARTLSGVELALLDAPAGTPHRDDLRSAERGLRQTARLVDELLHLARADAADGPAGGSAGGGPLVVRLYLDDLVSDAIAGWGAAARAAGLCLTQSTLDEAPVEADPALVDRLIGVLIDNAIRYTPPGGAVDVSVRRDGGQVCVEVADTGIGIALADRARVAERFYRGAEARRMRPDGSGLGLAIAHGAAAAMGGALTLDPRDGGGTVARATFRAA